MLEYSRASNDYLDNKSILDFLAFQIKSGDKDAHNAIECLNFNFEQFFEYCKVKQVVRPFKKDYLD